MKENILPPSFRAISTLVGMYPIDTSLDILYADVSYNKSPQFSQMLAPIVFCISQVVQRGTEIGVVVGMPCEKLSLLIEEVDMSLRPKRRATISLIPLTTVMNASSRSGYLVTGLRFFGSTDNFPIAHGMRNEMHMLLKRLRRTVQCSCSFGGHQKYLCLLENRRGRKDALKLNCCLFKKVAKRVKRGQAVEGGIAVFCHNVQARCASRGENHRMGAINWDTH
jgi:hypothetical protein